MDVSRLSGLGWKASITLKDGIQMVCADFIKKYTAGELDRGA